MMDGLEVQRINDDNSEYLVMRARCTVAAFLASGDRQQELPEKDFDALLAGTNEALAECDECGHLVSRHGKEGCTCNRNFITDGVETDGPCGCTAYTWVDA